MKIREFHPDRHEPDFVPTQITHRARADGRSAERVRLKRYL